MKIPDRRIWLLISMGVMLTALPALAHHSFASEYDAKDLISLTGTITKVEWTNPHIYFYIDAKDANGNVVNWAVEGYPPNTLKRTGFSRADLKVGDTVTITGYKAKDSSTRLAGREITFPDGTKKFAGPAGGSAPPTGATKH